jgi:diaminobutyrate-2-oxoglutarate transaminase
MGIFERMESEVRGYIRSFPVVFEQAQGAVMQDEDGETYIDFFSGAGTLNYGHNEPRLKQRLLKYVQEDGIIHGLDMATSAKQAFLNDFEQIILKPRGLNYKLQFTGPTGTNAVEAAIKLARKVKKRRNIVAFTNGFHGMTLGALAATANRFFREGAATGLDQVTHMPYDGYLGRDINTIDILRKYLEDGSSGLDLPAAVLLETVQGEGGLNVAGARWLRQLRRLCDEFDILMIVDDIQVGCGRTGRFFSFEEVDIVPDIVTLSKSLSAYGLPMALVLMKPELDIWKPAEHNGTFRGNNLAFVTSSEALRLFWDDGGQFALQVRRKGRSLRGRLEEISEHYPEVKTEVRGRGMMQGVEFKVPEIAGRIAKAAFERGLIIETSGADGQVVKCLPPLNIGDDALEEGLSLLEQAFADVLENDGVDSVATEDRKESES